MSMVMSERYGNIRIPAWVVDVDSFFRWFDAARMPEKTRVHLIRGEVWLDVSMEELFAHNQIKTALGIALGGLIVEEKLGLYITDGMMLANASAGLVTCPDAMFVSNAALKAKRVKFSSGKRSDAEATRLLGTPDLVVEVVSASSEEKDTEWLMSAYHNAGIPEYWLIDGRDALSLRFAIYKRGGKEYLAMPPTEEWVKSPVLKRSFRLIRSRGNLGLPVYRLDAR